MDDETEPEGLNIPEGYLAFISSVGKDCKAYSIGVYQEDNDELRNLRQKIGEFEVPNLEDERAFFREIRSGIDKVVADSLKLKMSERGVHENYGDVVIIERIGLEALSGLAKYEHSHAGLLTGQDTMDVMTPEGVVSVDLVEDLERLGYGDFLIVQHREMGDQTRTEIEDYNKSAWSREYPYDHKNKRRATLRQLVGIKPDGKDISNRGLTDTSRVGFLYGAAVSFFYGGVECPVNGKVHISQLLPRHFLESEHFEIVQYPPHLKLVHSEPLNEQDDQAREKGDCNLRLLH